ARLRNPRLTFAKCRTAIRLSIVSSDSSSETPNTSTTAAPAAAAVAPKVKPPSAADETKPATAASSEPQASGPIAMVVTPGGGDAWPGPLAEKQFAGEMESDFETALKMVQSEERYGEASDPGLVKAWLARAAGWTDAIRSAVRQDRHVAFDGFRSPLHDDKTERDRRYGTVYTVTELAN